MADPPSRDQVRAADRDRESIVRDLGEAHAVGRLGPDEHHQRVRSAWAAATYGDLDELAADLPSDPDGGTDEVEPTGTTAADPGTSWQSPAAAGFYITFLSFGFWLVLQINATDPVHPWWLWIAGAWAIGLVPRELIKRRREGRL